MAWYCEKCLHLACSAATEIHCPHVPQEEYMTDTPRTDHAFKGSHLWSGFIHEFCRCLERELNSARNDCDGLMLTVQELRQKIATVKTDK